MGFNYLKATATSRRQFTFYHSVPRNSWYSFYRPRKDERLSPPWSHPLVLDTGLLNWQSSVLTTRPLLHNCLQSLIYICGNFGLRVAWLNSNCRSKFLKMVLFSSFRNALKGEIIRR